MHTTPFYKIDMRYLFPCVAGILLCLGFPGNSFPWVEWGWLVPVALVPYFFSMPHKGTGKLFKDYLVKTWIFGFTVQLIGFYWVSKPMLYFTNLHPTVAYTSFLIIEALSAVYFILVLCPVYLLFQKKKKISVFDIIACSCSVMMLEIIIPRFFHWTLPGLMQDFTVFNQLSSLLGPSTGTFFIVFLNLVVYFFLKSFFDHRSFFTAVQKNKTLLTISFGLVLFIISFGLVHIKNEKRHITNVVKIGYLQPNFTFDDIAIHHLPAINPQKESLEIMLDMSQKLVQKNPGKIDLLVWPESTAPSWILYNNAERAAVQNFIQKNKIPILMSSTQMESPSVLSSKKEPLYWSSAFIFTENGPSSEIFQKWLPMPFGEHIPLEDTFPQLGNIYRKWFPNAALLQVGKNYNALPFQASTGNHNGQKSEIKDRFHVGPLICFDSILQKLPRLQASGGGAQFFVNLANFVWMADSNAGHEFAHLNQLRAVENSRSVLMASNSGPSFAFDPVGRPLLKSPQVLLQNSGVVTLPISDGKTLFSIVGEVPAIVLGVLGMLWVVVRGVR